jgi:hypothetical protein
MRVREWEARTMRDRNKTRSATHLILVVCAKCNSANTLNVTTIIITTIQLVCLEGENVSVNKYNDLPVLLL